MNKPPMATDLYLPEDPDYTLIDSVRDSVRFAHYCLQPGSHGKWLARSSSVDRAGAPLEGHPLAILEGPGREANAIGGALTLYRWARFDQNHILEKVALGLLDHALDDGFIPAEGPIAAFRDTRNGEFVLNSQHDGSWWNPSEQAEIGLQMLAWMDALPSEDPRVRVLESEASRLGELLVLRALWGNWVAARVGNGESRAAGPEAVSVPRLFMELASRGLGAHSEAGHTMVEYFARNMSADIESARDRAAASRLMFRAAEHFRNPAYDEIALASLAGMLNFVHRMDEGGYPTTGLVRTSATDRSIRTADSAGCALACLEAADRSGDRDRVCTGVTTLRGIARFHHTHAEPHGFLAAGLGSAGPEGSLSLESFTHPLFSNLRHVDAALHYFVRRIT